MNRCGGRLEVPEQAVVVLTRTLSALPQGPARSDKITDNEDSVAGPAATGQLWTGRAGDGGQPSAVRAGVTVPCGWTGTTWAGSLRRLRLRDEERCGSQRSFDTGVRWRNDPRCAEESFACRNSKSALCQGKRWGHRRMTDSLKTGSNRFYRLVTKS
jgi:hypothetical protein